MKYKTSVLYTGIIIYATCSDRHVKDIDNKRHDSLLELYRRRIDHCASTIYTNIGVVNCIVTGEPCASLKVSSWKSIYDASDDDCFESILKLMDITSIVYRGLLCCAKSVIVEIMAQLCNTILGL